MSRDGERPTGQVPRAPGEVVLDRIGEMALEGGNDAGVAGGVGAEPAKRLGYRGCRVPGPAHDAGPRVPEPDGCAVDA